MMMIMMIVRNLLSQLVIIITSIECFKRELDKFMGAGSNGPSASHPVTGLPEIIWKTTVGKRKLD